MKSLPVLLLTLRLSTFSGVGACMLFAISAWRAQTVVLDGRTGAFHMAATYAATLSALFFMSRVRKVDVARIVFGIFSLMEMAVWCVTARPHVADGSFNTWIAGSCGIAAAILPFYVETSRRSQRQRRRASDAVAQARDRDAIARP